MKDHRDRSTIDAFNRPRGRPATGKALTNAERQARHRAKVAKEARAEARRDPIDVLEAALRELPADDLRRLLARFQ